MERENFEKEVRRAELECALIKRGAQSSIYEMVQSGKVDIDLVRDITTVIDFSERYVNVQKAALRAFDEKAKNGSKPTKKKTLENKKDAGNVKD